MRDDGTKCIFCEYEATGETAAHDYISNVLGINKYEAVTRGGEFPQYECPECASETLVCDYDNDKVICFSCDYEDETAYTIVK